MNAFWRTSLATSIVCGKEIADQFEKINVLLVRVTRGAKQGEFVNDMGDALSGDLG
jgi:hypothetical protein